MALAKELLKVRVRTGWTPRYGDKKFIPIEKTHVESDAGA